MRFGRHRASGWSCRGKGPLLNNFLSRFFRWLDNRSQKHSVLKSYHYYDSRQLSWSDAHTVLDTHPSSRLMNQAEDFWRGGWFTCMNRTGIYIAHLQHISAIWCFILWISFNLSLSEHVLMPPPTPCRQRNTTVVQQGLHNSDGQGGELGSWEILVLSLYDDGDRVTAHSF